MSWHIISLVQDASVRFLSYPSATLLHSAEPGSVCLWNYVQSGPVFQNNVLVIYTNILPRKRALKKGGGGVEMAVIYLYYLFIRALLSNICKSQY